MKNNMGTIDRVIRILTAAIMAFFCFTNIITGPPDIILIGIALVLVTSGFLSYYPIYYLLGFITIRRKS